MSRKKIGELLLERKLITPEQLARAIRTQQEVGGRLGSILIQEGYVSPDDLLNLLSEQLGVQAAALDRIEIDPSLIQLLPADLATKFKAVPVKYDKGVLTVAIANPENYLALEDIRFVTGARRVEPVVATEQAIKEAIRRYYTPDPADLDVLDDGALFEAALAEIEEEEGEDFRDQQHVIEIGDEIETRPIINLVNMIFDMARKQRASDVHIEPHETFFRVRFRVDGVLHDVLMPPKRLHRAITSRIKVISGMDVSVRMRAQDGHVKVRFEDDSFDIRVSSLPTMFGEKIVLRLLKKDVHLLALHRLGFSDWELQAVKSIIRRPQGMFLVTGPTGSGKTTTLHAILNEINEPTINIVTLEDPTEYTFQGINHVQVAPKAGLTFAEGLRSILRQDPDVIMVGEIRDSETVQISVRAALTGHLVLSTLHTLGSIETVMRLQDMGVESYIVADALIAVLAQRLIRAICHSCKEQVAPDPTLLTRLPLEVQDVIPQQFFAGAGCKQCLDTGYRGRTALYELLLMTSDLAPLVRARAPMEELETAARLHGFRRLIFSGMEKISAGVSTLEEVLRAVATKEG
jgi:type IV pilus assembly protein PilB